LLDAGVAAAEVDAIDQSVEEEVRDAVEFADESPAPSQELMHRLVYAPSPEFVLTDPEAPHAVHGNLVGGG
jgi:TPP-dependent pyruvate/acetoin dehydrogenase alpha subunit